jgi:REP element-mobilizing transposase RayT
MPDDSGRDGGIYMTYDSGVHHRRSIRLQGYDYSQNGAYFVTICAQNRECLFGDVADGELILNAFGEIVAGQWHAIPERFPHVGMDAFVVMPNHIHGIVIINGVGAPLAGAPSQSLAGAPCIQNVQSTTNGPRPITPDDGVTETDNRATARVAPTVGEIVGAYKSICYRECLAWINNHEQDRRLGRLWQRNYWEHVIRDEMELNRIREYIRNNPAQWESDRLNPCRGGPCGRPSAMIQEPVVTYIAEGWMV